MNEEEEVLPGVETTKEKSHKCDQARSKARKAVCLGHGDKGENVGFILSAVGALRRLEVQFSSEPQTSPTIPRMGSCSYFPSAEPEVCIIQVRRCTLLV